MAYLTENELSSYCGVVDGVTMAHVESASYLIDAFKGSSFLAQEYAEHVNFISKPTKCDPFKPFRGKVRHLPRITIEEVYTRVNSVWGEMQTIAFPPLSLLFDEDNSVYFSFYPPRRMFNSPINFTMPIDHLMVKYVAGYEEGNYPEALKRATGMLAQNLKQLGGTLQWKSRDDYDTKVTLADNSIFSDEIKQLVGSIPLS